MRKDLFRNTFNLLVCPRIPNRVINSVIRLVSVWSGVPPMSLAPPLQHPVYCVNVVGTQNANNLITVSTDGKMCSWNLDMLSQPQVSTWGGGG